MERVILHSDLNNFYASVECLHHPELRGKPIAVAGDPEKRHGIILAKNDLAKQFGITTGNPLWMARENVPASFSLSRIMICICAFPKWSGKFTVSIPIRWKVSVWTSAGWM